jgi:hypothetical protein
MAAKAMPSCHYLPRQNTGQNTERLNVCEAWRAMAMATATDPAMDTANSILMYKYQLASHIE